MTAATIARRCRSSPPRPRDFEHAAAYANGSLSKGERVILIAAAQHPEGVTREQLTVLTGYKRSSRDTYLQGLGQKGYVTRGDVIRATDEGVAALGSDYEPLPTGDALRDYWMNRLSGGERVLFDFVVRAYPEWIACDELSEKTDYKRSSRDTYLQKLAARKLVERDRGSVRASDDLFS